MSKQQQTLMHIQRHDLIESQSEESDSDNRNVIYSNLDNKNPLVRLFALGKIRKDLMTLTEPSRELSNLDIRLLQGFYTANRR